MPSSHLFIRRCSCTLNAVSLAVALTLCLATPSDRASGQVDTATKYTTPLSTGGLLDAVGDAIELGNMPLGMAVAPGADRCAVVLSGWREQGLQIVDLKSIQTVQTLQQDAAFLGVAFSRDGKELYVSGGNDDSIFCYSWENG